MSKNIISLIIAALLVSAISAIIQGINIGSPAGIGFVIGGAAAAVGIAVIVTCIPAGIYWLIKRKKMPGFNIAIWVLWVSIAVLSLIGNML